MGPQEWRFVLVGDKLDIHTIVELFTDGASIVEDEHGQSVLTLNMEFVREESQAAKDAAEAHVAKLNAVAQIAHGNHQNVHIGAFGHRDSSTGLLQYFLHMNAPVRSSARMGIGGMVSNADGPPSTLPKQLGDRLFDAAAKDEHLQRALYLYGSLPLDWRGLYMVWEAAKDHCGSEKKLTAKNWVPGGQIKHFRETANSYKALGSAARHGSTKDGIDKPKLTLAEAREMVRTILQKWCKEAELAP